MAKRWLIVSLLFFGGCISYLDRAALSIAAPLIVRDFNLDPAHLGFVFSVFFLGYAPMSFIGGFAADRLGAKRMFAVTMAVWSLACGATAAVVSFPFLIVVRFIFGMGEGPLSATTVKMVSNWFAHREQATAVGIAIAGQPLGAALAGPVVGVIAASFGWRVSFICIAAVGLVWVALWVLLAKEKPAGLAGRLDLPVKQTAAARQATAPRLRDHLKSPTIIATSVGFFSFTYVLYFFLSWFPMYLVKVHHLSVEHMGLVSVIPWVSGSIGLAAGGIICDYVLKITGNALLARKSVLVVNLLVTAVCVALAGKVDGLVAAVSLMAVGVFFLYTTTSVYYAIVLDTVAKQSVGAVSGFINLVANLAGVVAPLLTGYVLSWTGSFTYAFTLAGAVALVGALCIAKFVVIKRDLVSISSLGETPLA